MGRSKNNFTSWVSNPHTIGGRNSPPEERLFVAVLSQAIHDAFSKHVSSLERVKAQSWLMSNSRDFRSICEHAGRNSGYVLEKIRHKILEKNGWNVNLSLGATPSRIRKHKRKHLTGNAYYAAKRQTA